MHLQKIIKFAFVATCFILAANSSIAQHRAYDSTTANILNEIAVIQSVLQQTPYLSFDATYVMEDIDSVTVRDTIPAKYKLNGNNMYLIMLKDTIEGIQNENYFASVYHSNKTIVVQKPVAFAKQLFQVDVSDTLFQNMAMSGATASDIGNGARTITILFDSNALYKSYSIIYITSTFRPIAVSYSLKKELNPASTKVVNFNLFLGNYQTGTFTNAVFSTNSIIVVNGSSDIRLASCVDPAYEIVNLIEPVVNINPIN